MLIFSWLQKLFDNTPPPPKPRPNGWNKTLATLQAENRNLSGEEIAWAREYEIEQLRTWARFPMDGDVFIARCDVPVDYVIHWRAPYSTGGKGVLPKGTRIRVHVIGGETEPLAVTAIPLEEKAMGEVLVPELDRLSAKYDGYSLALNVAQLNTDFELSEESSLRTA